MNTVKLYCLFYVEGCIPMLYLERDFDVFKQRLADSCGENGYEDIDTFEVYSNAEKIPMIPNKGLFRLKGVKRRRVVNVEIREI